MTCCIGTQWSISPASQKPLLGNFRDAPSLGYVVLPAFTMMPSSGTIDVSQPTVPKISAAYLK